MSRYTKETDAGIIKDHLNKKTLTEIMERHNVGKSHIITVLNQAEFAGKIPPQPLSRQMQSDEFISENEVFAVDKRKLRTDTWKEKRYVDLVDYIAGI